MKFKFKPSVDVSCQRTTLRSVSAVSGQSLSGP